MTGMIIRVQSSCAALDATKAQFLISPDVIWVRKVITVMISCAS